MKFEEALRIIQENDPDLYARYCSRAAYYSQYTLVFYAQYLQKQAEKTKNNIHS